jgi:AraC family transcriptional regulator
LNIQGLGSSPSEDQNMPLMRPGDRIEDISPVKRPTTVQQGPGSQMFGSTLAAIFNAPKYHCALKSTLGRPEFAVTRLQAGPRPIEKAPVYPRDDALLVCVSLTPTAVNQWRALYGGREVGVSKSIAFATTALDLRCPMEMWVRGPFDYLHYYLSDSLLKSVADENEIATPSKLQEVFFVEDLVVAQLTRSILSQVRHGQPLDKLELDQVAMLLGAHVLQRYCRAIRATRSSRSGLRTWQRIRAAEMLRAQLDGNISIKELATACSLSSSHFARGFRRSFGTTVHQYLIRIRLEKAKALLTGTKKKLSEIAPLSGFCDQAALSRAFSRAEQETPSRWRRRNASI